MKATARPLPDGVGVELRAKPGCLWRGARVSPIEDWGGRHARGVDSHETVPERGAAHCRNASNRIAQARDHSINGLHSQIEQRLGREGGAAVRSRLQSVGELLLRLADGLT